ncbi:hybrid-cluster NAD(P)-dependent oxidoreductase [Streptomyces diacarni]|uniref:hybrid-cluster NAD(P)-dependent oxidoreductase n=1 Tax=Streptomyces diacarni TaxID=2800381 RepID=UPI0033FD09EA
MNDLLAPPGAECSEPGAPYREGDGAQDQRLVCTHIQTVTAEMKTFVFEPATPGLFRYEPGQYLAFTFRIDGREVDRCYTLSSAPTRPRVVAITVKRVPGGLVSNWLHDQLAPGDLVRARGPLGDFSTARYPAPSYLFLSGGSGITPLMSMTRTLYDLASPADVVFVHSARTLEDVPFRQELELIARTAPHVRVVHVCEDDGPAPPPWLGHRGRLTPDLLRRIAPDFPEREVFTCGPPGYMRAVRRMLSAADFPREHYHQESFDAAQEGFGAARESFRTAQERFETTRERTTGADPGAAPAGAATFTVKLARSGTTLACDAGTPVLEAAARAGVTLPSSCGEGVCGSCMTTLEKGSVDMRHNGGIRPRDTASNKILLCCSTPLEDLVIDA